MSSIALSHNCFQSWTPNKPRISVCASNSFSPLLSLLQSPLMSQLASQLLSLQLSFRRKPTSKPLPSPPPKPTSELNIENKTLNEMMEKLNEELAKLKRMKTINVQVFIVLHTAKIAHTQTSKLCSHVCRCAFLTVVGLSTGSHVR